MRATYRAFCICVRLTYMRASSTARPGGDEAEAWVLRLNGRRRHLEGVVRWPLLHFDGMMRTSRSYVGVHSHLNYVAYSHNA